LRISEFRIKILPGKSKRELQFLLATIDKDGNPCDDEPTIEVKIRMMARKRNSGANRPTALDFTDSRN
jgi:hypothetical protein